MTKQLFATLLIGAAVLLNHSAWAEQKKIFDEYEVHYSVLNSTFLTPEIAQSYGITRGKNRAMLNISVRKVLTDRTDRAQKALVFGESSDLMRNLPLEFREINEQNAIYYIAEIKFRGEEEVRNFTIQVQPDVNRPPYTLKFSKTLYRGE